MEKAELIINLAFMFMGFMLGIATTTTVWLLWPTAKNKIILKQDVSGRIIHLKLNGSIKFMQTEIVGEEGYDYIPPLHS